MAGMIDAGASAAQIATPVMGIFGFLYVRIELSLRTLKKKQAICELREKRDTIVRGKHVEVIDILIDRVEIVSPDDHELKRAKRILKRIETPAPDDELTALAKQIDALLP